MNARPVGNIVRNIVVGWIIGAVGGHFMRVDFPFRLTFGNAFASLVILIGAVLMISNLIRLIAVIFQKPPSSPKS
jgi:uncharacterized membrane protein YeaQ/YmgE (transglycosylase-associated protein family)